MNSIVGYFHKDSRYLTSTAGNGSSPDNIPFYFRGGPPNHFRIRCTTGTMDQFARGICSSGFDTIFTISYQIADLKANRKIKYEIQLTNSHGDKKILQKSLMPNGCDVLKLSDLVKETDLSDRDGFYTIWLFSSEAHLCAHHILWRRSDNAIAVEHFYAGKFGL